MSMLVFLMLQVHVSCLDCKYSRLTGFGKLVHEIKLNLVSVLWAWPFVCSIDQ